MLMLLSTYVGLLIGDCPLDLVLVPWYSLSVFDGDLFVLVSFFFEFGVLTVILLALFLSDTD